MNGKELLQLLEKRDWKLMRINGSHHILKKNGKIVVVPVHGNTDLKPGILHSILKKAGLK